VADPGDGFVLLGDPTEETRLLVHRGCGYSTAIPGHPSLGAGAEPAPRYDAVITLGDLRIEHGVRLDSMPTGMEPQALATALATTYANARSDGPAKVSMLPPPLRPVDAAVFAHYVVRDAPDHMELLVVLVRPHATGLWALFHTIRHAFREVNPVQWFHLRAAVLASQHWDPEAPRTASPSLFPSSAFAEASAKLAFTPDAWAEAQRKATDIGPLSDVESTSLLELVLEFARSDDPPTLPVHEYVTQVFMRQLAGVGPTRAAEALMRNLDQVRTVHDLRAWCWQCVWAIGNRDDRGTAQRTNS
jgi:hypothetical protein